MKGLIYNSNVFIFMALFDTCNKVLHCCQYKKHKKASRYQCVLRSEIKQETGDSASLIFSSRCPGGSNSKVPVKFGYQPGQQNG